MDATIERGFRDVAGTQTGGLRLVRLAGMHETITAEAGQVVDWWPPSKCCPECGQRGRERAGAEFQHQNRCKDCGHVWSPDTAYLRIRQRKLEIVSKNMSAVPSAVGGAPGSVFLRWFAR